MAGTMALKPSGMQLHASRLKVMDAADRDSRSTVITRPKKLPSVRPTEASELEKAVDEAHAAEEAAAVDHAE